MGSADQPSRASKTRPGHDDHLVAANVARLRKEAEISQAELARRMQEAGQEHWRQTTVSRVERGLQRLGMDELEAISGILGNVLEGTQMAKVSSDVAGKAIRAITGRKLRSADDALADALFHVRQLRVLHDPGYDSASARADYEEDMRRGFGEEEA